MKIGRPAIYFLSLLALAAPAVRGADPGYRLQPAGNGVWAAIASDDGLSGGNAGFVVGDNGVAVIDTFQDPRAAEALLADIRKVTRLPIRFVVNTHYHLDHVNGNDVFASAGATIVAHRNVRAWMRTENLKMLDPPVTAEKRARVMSLTLPTLVHDGHVELYLGSRRLDVRYYPGHTGGDSVVWVPDAKKLFCGDMLWKDHVPNLIDATTEAWIDSLARMQKDYSPSMWIPGHGGLASGQDVQTFRTYLLELRANVRREQSSGKSGDALAAALLPVLQAKDGRWGFFRDYARAGVIQTEEEFRGVKRLPPPPAH
jgi:cyclase